MEGLTQAERDAEMAKMQQKEERRAQAKAAQAKTLDDARLAEERRM